MEQGVCCFVCHFPIETFRVAQFELIGWTTAIHVRKLFSVAVRPMSCRTQLVAVVVFAGVSRKYQGGRLAPCRDQGRRQPDPVRQVIGSRCRTLEGRLSVSQAPL